VFESYPPFFFSGLHKFFMSLFFEKKNKNKKIRKLVLRLYGVELDLDNTSERIMLLTTSSLPSSPSPLYGITDHLFSITRDTQFDLNPL